MTNAPNGVPTPRFCSSTSRLTTLTTTSSSACTVAVRTPPDSTAVSPNTAPGPSRRSTIRVPLLSFLDAPDARAAYDVKNAQSPWTSSVTMEDPGEKIWVRKKGSA